MKVLFLLLFTSAVTYVNALANPLGKNDGVATSKSKGAILIIASSANKLQLKEGKIVPTGYFLDELAVPAQMFIKDGYEIILATPKGNIPVIDEHSNHPSLFHGDESKLKEALDFVHNHPAMLAPVSLASVVKGGLDRYAALYIPGGHAPMVDLMEDKDLGTILNYFHEKQKPTAFLCHGPIATLAALAMAPEFKNALIANDADAISKLGKSWIYKGYRMTIYSNEEEYGVEEGTLKGKLQFYVADALKKAGGKVEKSSQNGIPLVIRDRELITGQNPASDHWIGEEILKSLNKNRK